jgi:hypothetical protein
MTMSLSRNTTLRTFMEMCVAWAVAQNIVCMMPVSMDALPSGQAVFQISNTVRCFSYTWPTSLPDLAVPKSYVKRKLHKMYPANSDALKTEFRRIFKGPIWKCCNILRHLTITIPGLFWMAPWLQTKCHIKISND